MHQISGMKCFLYWDGVLTNMYNKSELCIMHILLLTWVKKTLRGLLNYFDNWNSLTMDSKSLRSLKSFLPTVMVWWVTVLKILPQSLSRLLLWLTTVWITLRTPRAPTTGETAFSRLVWMVFLWWWLTFFFHFVNLRFDTSINLVSMDITLV